MSFLRIKYSIEKLLKQYALEQEIIYANLSLFLGDYGNIKCITN